MTVIKWLCNEGAPNKGAPKSPRETLPADCFGHICIKYYICIYIYIYNYAVIITIMIMIIISICLSLSLYIYIYVQRERERDRYTHTHICVVSYQEASCSALRSQRPSPEKPCTQALRYVQICMYVCIYIYIYTYVYTCLYIYIYIYAHIHIMEKPCTQASRSETTNH